MKPRPPLTAGLLAWVSIVLLTAVAHAQIVVPEQIDEHTVFPAALSADVPPGSQISGGWEALTASSLPTGDPMVIHLTAAPGKHVVRFRGAWCKTEPVQVGDKTILALLGFGFLDYATEFEVRGEQAPVPPPLPPVPPVPQEPRWGVIVEETDNRTVEQGNLWANLRKVLPLNKLLIVDQNSQAPSLAPTLEAVREAKIPLPVLVVFSAAGDVVGVVACPTSVESVQAKLK